MSGLVRIIISMLVGLALGIVYNAWMPLDLASLRGGPGGQPVVFDMVSYGAGLLVGMVLWQVGNVPWSALPGYVQTYLASQMQFYQFVIVGALCLGVLFYL